MFTILTFHARNWMPSALLWIFCIMLIQSFKYQPMLISYEFLRQLIWCRPLKKQYLCCHCFWYCRFQFRIPSANINFAELPCSYIHINTDGGRIVLLALRISHVMSKGIIFLLAYVCLRILIVSYLFYRLSTPKLRV